MDRQVMTKQRSPWKPIDSPGLIDGGWYERRVHDGVLAACVAQEPLGPGGRLEWHMSISFRNHRGEFSRYPTWDEIAHARYELLPEDLTFVMFLPPMEEYVAVHATTFHLHEHSDA